jgi:hypothetical protein
MQNWHRLEIFTGGEWVERDPKVRARRFYDAFDLVQLRIIKRLDGLVPLNIAGEIAKSKLVYERFLEIGLPPVDPEDGVVIATRRALPERSERRFAVAMLDIDNALRTTVVNGTELHKFIECIVVPLDQIIIETVDDYFEWMLDQERTNDD